MCSIPSAESQTRTQRTPSARWIRWHALCGVLPVSVFLPLHILMQSRALLGAPGFDAPLAYDSVWLLAAEVLFIHVPLLLHIAFGLFLSFRSPVAGAAIPAERNQAQAILRMSGLVALVFIAYHLWEFRFQVIAGRLDAADVHVELCAALSSTTELGIPAVAVTYLLGLAACCIHFAFGLRSWLEPVGTADVQTTAARLARWTARSAGWVAIGLFLIGTATIVQLATGSWIPRM